MKTKNVSLKTAKTIKECKIETFGYGIVIPVGSKVSNQTACGPDDHYRFWEYWQHQIEEMTGFKESSLAHDITYRGINIPPEFCEPYRSDEDISKSLLDAQDSYKDEKMKDVDAELAKMVKAYYESTGFYPDCVHFPVNYDYDALRIMHFEPGERYVFYEKHDGSIGKARVPNLISFSHTVKDNWAEHPDYPLSDWSYSVMNGDTRFGYHDWISDKKEEAR